MSEDRQNAEDAARALHAELESIGVDLGDIDVPGLCPADCPGGGSYRVRLGVMGVEQVEGFTAALRRLKQQAAGVSS